MTTANPNVLNHDGAPATPYAQGAGRIDVDNAIAAGLLFDESHADYLAADPADGGDPKTLNLPSFANFQCLGTCTWERAAAAPASAPAGVTWTASVVSDAGLTLTVGLTAGTLNPGESTTITVGADVTGAPFGETLFGRVTLTPSNAAVPVVTMPVAVVPSSGIFPTLLDLDTRRDTFSELVTGLETIALEELQVTAGGLVIGDQTAIDLAEDPTNTDAYNGDGGTFTTTLEIPDGTSRAVFEILSSTAPDVDLFIGTGTTPSAATEVCVSAGGTAEEYCNVEFPAPGTYWVLVQNWEGSAAPTDQIVLSTGVVAEDEGNLTVDGPDGPLATGTPYDLRVLWDEPAMQAGDKLYGSLTLGSAPATPGNIGTIAVDLARLADDVSKQADVATAAPGDTVTYTLEVQPNVTPVDLAYTITDTIPAGMTYVPGSASDPGVTVTGQELTWTPTMATAVGAQGSYAITQRATDPACGNPVNGGGYVDLATFALMPNAALTGDTVAFTGFTSGSPISFHGVDYTGMSFTDDGFVLFDAAANYGGSPWLPQALPNAAVPNNLAALLWNDYELVYDAATGAGVTTATLGGSGPTSAAVVEYDNLRLFDDDGSSGLWDVEVFVFRTVDDTPGLYEIYIAYDNLGPLTGPVTIGGRERRRHRRGRTGEQRVGSRGDQRHHQRRRVPGLRRPLLPAGRAHLPGDRRRRRCRHQPHQHRRAHHRPPGRRGRDRERLGRGRRTGGGRGHGRRHRAGGDA